MDCNILESVSFCGMLINRLSEGLVILDSSGSICFVNSSAEKMFGAGSGDLIGQTLGLPLTNESAVEIEIFNKNGPMRLAEIRSAEIFHDGKVWTVCSLRDVSLREVSEQLSLALEATHLGLWDWNSKLDSVKYDSRAVEILGLDNEKTVWDLEDIQLRIHPDDLVRVMEGWKAFIDGLTPYLEIDYRTLTGSGEYKPVLNRARISSRDKSGKPLRVFGALMDLTERESAAEAERLSSVKYISLVENIPMGMMYVNTEGDLLHCNPHFRQMFHLMPEEPGRSVNVYQTPSLLKTGIIELLQKSMGESSRVASELAYTSVSGKTQFIKCLIVPITNLDGTLRGCQVIVEDTTDQKEAQHVLLENEKLKATAGLAIGVAHSFNNILQIILGSANLAIGHIQREQASDAINDLENIVDNATQGAGVVRRLQDYAGITSDPKESRPDDVLDLSLVVKDALESSRPWWTTNAKLKGIQVEVSQRLSFDLMVEGRTEELLDVTMNLIKNAVEAMPEGGKLTVTTRRKDDKALLIVDDTGVGLSKQDRKNIFQPFWTTKGYQFRGLGLSSSLGIIKRSGGSISVHSGKDSGTRMTVTLPIHEAAAISDSQITTSLPEKLRILCVDDDASILEVLKAGLEMNDHLPEVAISGRQAIEKFRNEHFDLILSDLGMPEMTGWELGAAIKKICIEKGIPKTPFFLLTGWGAQSHHKEEIERSGVDAIFTKPISLRELMSMIKRRLGSK